MIRALLALVLLVFAGCAHAPESPASSTKPTAPAPKTHLDWRREAAAARQRHDYPAFLAATESALKLRPDSPTYLYNLACAYALNGRPRDALDALRRLCALGVVLPLEQDADLASVRLLPGFKEIRVAMHHNAQPHGKVAPLFDLPNRTGIVEGIAYLPATDDYLLADVHERCVWRSLRDGTLTRFSAPDPGLLGVFKLQLDEAHGLLWASTSALPEISGYTPELKGQGALVAFDLKTGKIVKKFPLPTDGRNHCIGDFLLAPDGTFYLPDSIAPVIWRLRPGADHLEKFVESREFSSLQGAGLMAHNTKLVVTDYTNGIFVVDLATQKISAVTPPAHATLLGIDQFLAKGDTLLAVQNGVEPQRVVRVTLSSNLEKATRLEILASGQPGFDDLAHFTLVDGWLMIVGHSGWSDFDQGKGAPPPHTIRVMTINAP
ncbi:MAG: hypothetical protein JWM35_1980 [Verrucomicrobia bacterium]|nr:hypothetical protein [Verrucomicrobiota bacterium]